MASLYVGTYAKYNAGSIAGAWIDLAQFSDKDSFLEYCAKLHSDETDPEFMFQDFEGFPERFYCESGIDDELFYWLLLDDDDQLLLEAYINATGDNDATIDDAKDRFYGQFDSDLNLAHEYVESTGLLTNVDETIARYFDYESFARDLAYDFIESNGYYFFN